MFDKLVESTIQKQGRRAGGYFVATCLIYAVALVALGVVATIGFSPVLAEEFDLLSKLAPPTIAMDRSVPEVQRTHRTEKPQPGYLAIEPRRPVDVPRMDMPMLRRDFEGRTNVIPPGLGHGEGSGVIWGRDEGAPPPPPSPAPKAEPTPTPDVDRKPLKVSVGVLQGKAIEKPKPVYPDIAKKNRASGPVQVLVTISEEGRVTEARAINGHPLLKGAAEEAARRWRFTPTFLSNVPVMVQGMLTFNFILE